MCDVDMCNHDIIVLNLSEESSLAVCLSLSVYVCVCGCLSVCHSVVIIPVHKYCFLLMCNPFKIYNVYMYTWYMYTWWLSLLVPKCVCVCVCVTIFWCTHTHTHTQNTCPQCMLVWCARACVCVGYTPCCLLYKWYICHIHQMLYTCHLCNTWHSSLSISVFDWMFLLMNKQVTRRCLYQCIDNILCTFHLVTVTGGYCCLFSVWSLLDIVQVINHATITTISIMMLCCCSVRFVRSDRNRKTWRCWRVDE